MGRGSADCFLSMCARDTVVDGGRKMRQVRLPGGATISWASGRLTIPTVFSLWVQIGGLQAITLPTRCAALPSDAGLSAAIDGRILQLQPSLRTGIDPPLPGAPIEVHRASQKDHHQRMPP